MPFRPKQGWFLAFTAAFAVLAGFVFWGTWSADWVPVMPDCPTSFPPDYAEDWIRGWKQSGKFVPGDAIAFLGSPYFWVELKYVLATYCAALGTFYFLRGRGLSRVASYGAGLLLAFSGYWLTLFSAGHLGWFQWMTYGVFAFGLVDRACEKGRLRHWLLLGAVMAWGSFYQPDLWLLFTAFTSCYFVFRWCSVSVRAFRNRPPDATGLRPALRAFLPPKALIGSAIALAAFLLIGLPSFRSAICSDLAGRDRQIAEGQTLSGESKGEDARFEFVTNWSMPPEDTLEFVRASVRGDTSCPLTLAIGQARGTDVRRYTGRLGRPRPLENDPDATANYRQHSLYVGWLTCLLALLGLASPFAGLAIGRKDPSARPLRHLPPILFFTLAAVIFYLFSLGRFCEPVYRFVYRLPMGDYLRAPVKWHHLTEFCLAVLAGFGLDFAFRALRQMRVPCKVAAGICAALVLIGATDLARQAKRFCAPHRAGCELVPVQPYQQGMFPSSSSQRTSFEQSAKANGYAVVGWDTLQLPDAGGRIRAFDLPYLMPQKGLMGVRGVLVQDVPGAGELKMPVVDYAPRPATVRKAENELGGAAFALAALSALSTLAVMAFLIAATANRRLDRRLMADALGF